MSDETQTEQPGLKLGAVIDVPARLEIVQKESHVLEPASVTVKVGTVEIRAENGRPASIVVDGAKVDCVTKLTLTCDWQKGEPWRCAIEFITDPRVVERKFNPNMLPE